MPRKARDRAKTLPHHVMSRCIPELNLFNCDSDKEVYLKMMKTATVVHNVTIISYCLMDNHVHMLIHPNGGDIGDFMKNINNPYAKYYNHEYDRRGHLFGDRYKNIVIKNNAQLLRTSTYIHNNPKDLQCMRGKSISEYKYSSINDYINPECARRIADPIRIFDILKGKSVESRNHYRVLLEIQSQDHEVFAKEVEKALNRGEYATEKKEVVRDAEPKQVLSALARLFNKNEPQLPMQKYRRKEQMFKCLAAISLRIFCGMTMKEMTKIFKGYTISGIGYLSKKGYDIFEKENLYIRLVQALEI